MSALKVGDGLRLETPPPAAGGSSEVSSGGGYAPASPAASSSPSAAPSEPRRSRPITVLTTVLATAAHGWWWSHREYGGPAGFRQRLGGAQVIVANPKIELGVATVGEARDFKIRVRNCSAETVKLLGCRSSCGCMTTSTLPTEVAPGGWHEVTGTIKATASGRQDRPGPIRTWA